MAANRNPPMSGYVAPGFEPVAEAFQNNFALRGEVGAAFAAVQDGVPLVDLWGGWAAPERPWTEDTLQVIFSGTKGVLATCVLALVDRGQLDLSAPVARYWPEFGVNGKHGLLVEHVVSHRAGLPGVFGHSLTHGDISDPVAMADLLAKQELPNDQRAYACYHALTIGWLCDALVRRIDGRSTGDFLREEIASPLGLDLWLGLPERLESRVGRLELAETWRSWDFRLSFDEAADPTRLAIWANPPLFPDDLFWNHRDFHAAEIPGGGGIATARSMARLYGCLALGGQLDGVQILRPATLDAGRLELSRFVDPFLSESMSYGTVFALQNETRKLGNPVDVFGHSGAGGSVHGAWPSHRVGFSYVMNEMRNDETDTRAMTLLNALQAVLERAK